MQRRTRALRAATVLTALAGCALATTVTACTDDGGDDDRAGGASEDEGAERAPAAILQVLQPGDIEPDLEPRPGALGTETLRVQLIAGGEADEIGRGRAARRPAEGETFVVVELEKHTVPIADTVPRPEQAEMARRGDATFSVQVGDKPPTAVDLDTPSYTPLPIDLDDPPQVVPARDPAAPVRRLLVVSAPEDVEDLDLVVTSAGLEQRISLLTGDPAPENAAVLARANRDLAGAVPPQTVSYTNTEFGMSAEGSQPVGVVGASLQWSTGSGATRRTAPAGRAFLQIMMDTSGFNFGLASELRLQDGTTLQALPAEDEILASVMPLVLFDVPADFTTGTLVFGKDYTWEVPTGGGTFSVDFTAPVEFALLVPTSV